jgi:flagellar protein FliL
MSEAAVAEKAPAPAGGNKMLLLMVLLFNVLIAGGLAYVVISGQQKQAAAPKAHAEGEEAAGGEEAHAEGEEAEPAAEGHAKKGAFGPLIDVGSFVANLGGPASKNYIKVALHVEAVNEESKATVEAAIVPIRSEALLFLSGITPDQAVGQEKIRALQDELLKRLTVLVGKKTIKRVYFSEFVVQ